ncbi:MAG: DUF4236 domain-containing protein [Betaproteobacteria bacterium]|nr:DUF4236 domain-containing protein [Betaproteobacteria bacterium]
MGLRFRKRFPLGKLLRLNVSGSGLSIGVGPPGLNFNIGPRGIRRTVGAPGTGVYYQDSTSWPKETGSSTQPETGGTSSSGFPWLGVLVLLLLAFGIARACSVVTPSSPSQERSAVQATSHQVASPSPAPPKLLPDRPLTRDEIRELQQALKQKGFNPGPVDGMVGPRTRTALQTFARQRGRNLPGEPTLRALEAVRAMPP